jgi:CBS domain containing-hemolysin-like protein
MKQINLNKFIIDNSLNITDEMEVLGMKFIKLKDGNYMIENSNGLIVSEKEKLELENRELVIEDIESEECQSKTTQKITKNKKRIKEIENGSIKKAS